MFRNPYNLLGKWLSLSRLQQLIGFSAIFILLLTIPSLQIWQDWRQKQQLTQHLIQQLQQIEHQQKIKSALSQKILQQQLTPDLAGQLAPLNQFIHQQLKRQQLHLLNSQWLFTQQPMLNLQVQGNFVALQLFIESLLQQQSLELSKLHIFRLKQEDQNAEFSIEAELSFQLK